MSATTSSPSEKPADKVAEKHTRIQSPSYPVMSLKEAIDQVAKVENRYRSATVERMDAAKLLGYSGLTGPANMALAALTSYGLLERLGKGELKVTERARAILHFDSPGELSDALLAAAFAPQLYRDLRDRFRGVAIPPDEGVMSYLNRQGFNPAAVKPATKAFLQTMAYLREQGVSESSGQAQDQGQESAPSQSREEPQRMSTAIMERPTHMAVARPYAPTPAPEDLTLNEPNLNIRGGTVRLEALLDFDGLTVLEDQIKALKTILKPKASPTGI